MRSDMSISARDLKRHFGTGAKTVRALDGVSIDLRRGALTLLKGPSGSGKSSLLAALSGLTRPNQGDVVSLGEELWKLSKWKRTRFRRRNCGFVFQAVGLFPALTAEQQIMLILEYMSVNKKEARARARALLDEVGLAGRYSSKPGAMSGGENQRVAIARILAKRPSLIFCDEPTSALDKSNGQLVARLLQQTAHKENAMVFCVTHDDRLTPYADRIVEIEDGRLVSDTDMEFV